MSDAAPKRILIVDDDPNICRFISESLRLRGYEVICCGAADQALATLAETPCDLALLDILLPGASGLDLCLTLRQAPATRTLPVVMMTAFYKQADQIRQAREQYGATDYLLKPFSLKSLHEKIAALVGTPVAASTERLSIEGALATTPLPRILHNLYSLQATGLLHLERGEVKKVVYIKNGYPIFVRSNLVREFLGQMLVRSGTLSAADLERSLQVARETGQRHGTVLVEMGLLTDHDLTDILRRQVVDKLLELFAWPDGSYRFLQAREFKEGITGIDLSPANLILQGLRAHAGRELLEQLLAPHLDRYLLPAENPLYRYQEIQLSVSERRIFDQCRGQLTPRDLLKRHQLSRREIEALLAALLVTGILEASDEPAAELAGGVSGELAEDSARREEFLKDYSWMMQQDYFTLLGVSEADPRDAVRRAYYALVKKYHPDRFFEQDLLPDLRDKVGALFQRISDAHETLIDPSRRARYLNERQGGKPTQANVQDILLAESSFRKGMSLFRARRFAEAQDEFARAAELSPNEAEYLAYQAWTAYKVSPGDLPRAERSRQTLLRAADLSPRLAIAHLYLGYLSKDEGNDKEAQRRFERALQCNANCTEAQRELRLMSMRREKVEKKGLLDLFRK